MPDVVRAHVQVSGRVQGVWFRASTADTARALGLGGWVRNTAQGVEAVFEGSRDAVETAIAWCHEGPPNAVVDDVDVTWETAEGLSGFAVRW
ncbi:MAG: acylphosphatase [Coriobacteriia bacterium]|nr:acylphosphatase [Coriobacteriia bacterium]